MHPLCCIAPIPRDGGGGGEESNISHSSPPLPPASHSKTSLLTSSSSSSSLPSRSFVSRIHTVTDSSSEGGSITKVFPRTSVVDHFSLRRSPSHSSANGKLKDLKEVKEAKSTHTIDASVRASLPSSHFHESKENRRDSSLTAMTCTVGSNAAGVLYKWVNFGKGWRPRWFVLQDGVLSYYKVHGHGKIMVKEGQKGFRVVGDESLRYMKKCRNANNDDSQPKISGELHLKVCKPDSCIIA